MLEKGMKVRVRENLEIGKVYGNIAFLECMTKFKGKKISIVKGIKYHGVNIYEIEESNFIWSEDMFESIEEDTESKKKKYIVLPCEIGDTVYYINDFHKKIVPVTVEGIYFYECGFKLHVSSEWSYFDLKENEWYPTQKAAEKVLKSMK